MRALPQLAEREQRAAGQLRYGIALTERLLMASRDGVHFQRWAEAFLRPGPERSETWNYGHRFIARHAVATPSRLPGAEPEMSISAGEGSWTGDANSLRGYTLRLDGFVAVTAPIRGGELVTKPITFEGDPLQLNLATSAAGGIRVDLQEATGPPIPGFALDDCPPVFGAALARTVTWNAGSDVVHLADAPVRLRFQLRDAELFALQFVTNARR